LASRRGLRPDDRVPVVRACVAAIALFFVLTMSGLAVLASMSPLIEPSAESYASPSLRSEHGLTYDAQSDRVVFFGGWDHAEVVQSDTWTYDLNSNAWTRMSPATSPAPRGFFGMAYDDESDRVILFGGGGRISGEFNDTWAYDVNTDTWTSMNPVVAPEPRLALRMAYDRESDRIVLFGGYVCSISECGAIRFNDTWLYDFNSNAWTDVTPTVGPPPVAFHALAYDTDSDRVILFGGVPTAVSPPMGETWAFDVNTNTWENRNPLGPEPSARWLHDMAYDAQSDRALLFSGLTQAQFSTPHTRDSETWTYDFDTNSWTRVEPTARPLGRLAHKMTYDTESNRVIMFGGEWPIHDTRNNETWVFDVGSSTWSQVGPVPPPPPVSLLVPFLIAVGAGVPAVAVAVVLWRRRRRKSNEGPKG